MQRSTYYSLGLILLAIASRFIPHPMNFAPVTAVALFGGAYIANKRLAMLIPFLIMFVSDLLIGFHNTLFFVYASFAVVVGIGYWLKNHLNTVNVVGATLAGSVFFFLFTNFGVWLMYYPLTTAGLIECYTLAIPFFRNSLLGDFFYVGVLFGIYEWVKRHQLQVA